MAPRPGRRARSCWRATSRPAARSRRIPSARPSAWGIRRIRLPRSGCSARRRIRSTTKRSLPGNTTASRDWSADADTNCRRESRSADPVVPPRDRSASAGGGRGESPASPRPAPERSEDRPRNARFPAPKSSGLCIGTTIDARNRGSRSSHSFATQSLIARQNAADKSSLKIACAPCKTLQIAYLLPNPSSACARNVSKSQPALPLAGFQSGRALIGALPGTRRRCNCPAPARAYAHAPANTRPDMAADLGAGQGGMNVAIDRARRGYGHGLLSSGGEDTGNGRGFNGDADLATWPLGLSCRGCDTNLGRCVT